jgi:MFS family permease
VTPLRLINFHFALRTVGASLAEVFGMVYLYGLGFSFAWIFLVYAGMQALRLLSRPLVVRIAAPWGLKATAFLGTLLWAGSYLLLSQVRGISGWLVAFIVVQAVAEALYWTAYHSLFALLTTKERRGADIGAKEGLVTLAHAAAPVLGGLAIVAFGFAASFVAASLFMLLSAASLLLVPDIPLPRPVPWREAWARMDKRGFVAHFGHGWYSAGVVTAWSLIVYLLVRDYVVAGALASLIVVFQIAAFWLVGRVVDEGKGRTVAYAALVLLVCVALGRAGLARDIPSIIAFDIAYAVAYCLYGPPLDTVLYNLAAEAPDIWKWQLLSETAVDFGYLLTWIAGFAIVSAGLDPRWTLIWSLGGLVVLFGAFRSYFAPAPRNRNSASST